MTQQHFDPEREHAEAKAITKENENRLIEVVAKSKNRRFDGDTPTARLMRVLGDEGMAKVERIVTRHKETHASYNQLSNDLMAAMQRYSQTKADGYRRWKKAHGADKEAVSAQTDAQLAAIQRTIDTLEMRLEQIQPQLHQSLQLRDSVMQTIRDRVPGGIQLDDVIQTMGWR